MYTYLILFHWIYLSNVWTFVCNNISIFVRNYSSSISKWSRYCDYSFIYNTFWNWFLTILFQEKFSKLKNSFFSFFIHTKVFRTYSKRFVTQKKKFPSNQACGLLSDGSVPRKWKFSIESEDKTSALPITFSSHFEIHLIEYKYFYIPFDNFHFIFFSHKHLLIVRKFLLPLLKEKSTKLFDQPHPPKFFSNSSPIASSWISNQVWKAERYKSRCSRRGTITKMQKTLDFLPTFT